jgi:hypothetical protein
MYTILRIGRRPRGEQSRAWDEGLGHQQKSGATGSCGATAECSCRAELQQPVGPPVAIHFHIPVLDGAYRLKRVFAIEWLEMTFSTDPKFVETALNIMLRSHEAVVDYTTPLGLAHLIGRHHYGPAPWVDDLARAEGNPLGAAAAGRRRRAAALARVLREPQVSVCASALTRRPGDAGRPAPDRRLSPRRRTPARGPSAGTSSRAARAGRAPWHPSCARDRPRAGDAT